MEEERGGEERGKTKWSTTCKHHRLKVQCKSCCSPPADGPIVISDSEDEDEDGQTEANDAASPRDGLEAAGRARAGYGEGDTESDEDTADDSRNAACGDGGASVEGGGPEEPGSRPIMQQDEHAQDDSRPEAGCADASAGSSATPSQTECGEEELLPSGWTRYVDTREGASTFGRPFYHNAALKLTQWPHPGRQAGTKGRAAAPKGHVESGEAREEEEEEEA